MTTGSTMKALSLSTALLCWSTICSLVAVSVTAKDVRYACDDDRSRTFYVEETEKEEPCIWLADPGRQTMRDKYCQEGERARRICRETCNACRDSCFDTDGTFLYEGVLRPCSWLVLRTDVMEQVCVGNHEATKVCPETCDICDTIEAEVSLSKRSNN
jgi:hypothetical protein